MLTLNEKKQLESIKQYMETILSQDRTGHAIDHIVRVVDHAQNIANTQSCDLFIVLASAYLHDVVDDKIVENTAYAYKELETFLVKIGVSQEKIQHIFSVISNISYSKQLFATAKTPLSLEAKIVQDADRLDALGAMGIIRTIYYGGVKKHPIYQAATTVREFKTKVEYRQGTTVIHHFYEKLLKIYEGLHTPYAKEIGKERHEFLITFLQQFHQEWID